MYSIYHYRLYRSEYFLTNNVDRSLMQTIRHVFNNYNHYFSEISQPPMLLWINETIPIPHILDPFHQIHDIDLM